MFKQIIQQKIETAVVKYFQAHPEVKLVCVVGSVGKTSTKNLIATVLSQKYRVGGALGNHNSELSAPLGILGVKFPTNIRNPFAWWAVLRAAKKRIKQPATVDVIVQELGTDHPGELASYGRYLNPDLTVLTAIAPEHMEFFKTIEAVAEDELSAINFSKKGIINIDDVDAQFTQFLSNSNITTYGSSEMAEYSLIPEYFSVEEGYRARFITPKTGKAGLACRVRLYGEHSLRPLAGALTVARELGMTDAEITASLTQIKPYPGRMNVLPGQRQTTIIDDSYNSSPIAVKSALKTLYELPTTQRIAVLGSMNELGEMSQSAHREVGELCDPRQLDLVITVGEQAEQYLAPSAKTRGCQVMSCKTALEAGGLVNKLMKRGAIILFKGSQGGIYLEEAIKIILASTDLENQLVRQDPIWLKRKRNFFRQFVNPTLTKE